MHSLDQKINVILVDLADKRQIDENIMLDRLSPQQQVLEIPPAFALSLKAGASSKGTHDSTLFLSASPVS